MLKSLLPSRADPDSALGLIRRLVADYGVARWRQYAVAMVLMAVAAGCTTLTAYLIGDVINQAYVNRDIGGVVRLSLMVLAICRVLVKFGEWTSTLALPATALSCSLLTHVRIYSGDFLPAWLLSLPMLMPVAVCGIDRLLASKWHSGYRVAIAATTAALILMGVVWFAVAPGKVE